MSATPMPPRIDGIRSRVTYTRRPGVDTRTRPEIILSFAPPYLRYTRSVPCVASSSSRKFLMKPSSLRSSAMRTLSREAGMSTFSCSARLALRMRVSMSAMGSLRMAYQLAFTMPGTSPLSASSRKHSRHISNFRRYARGRPHSLHRWYARVENFGVRCDFMMRAVFAIRLLLPERHAEVRQECLRVLVRPRRRDDVDVHPANLVD